MAVAAVPRSPDLFAPGFLARTWARLWPIAAFFALAAPAGMLRAMADDGPLPVRRQFSGIEELLLSTAPTRWLQGSFLDTPETQFAATALYITWYLVPITCGAWLLTFRAADYWRFIAFLLLVYYAAMPLFALFPLEAPWAHEDGIRRYVAERFPAQAGSDPNPHAAMPSLHVALIAGAAFWYGLRSAPGRIVFAYSVAMSVAVVYLGDHYVADVIAGYALALGVLLGVQCLQLPILSCELNRRGRRSAPSVFRRPNVKKVQDSYAEPLKGIPYCADPEAGSGVTFTPQVVRDSRAGRQRLSSSEPRPGS